MNFWPFKRRSDKAKRPKSGITRSAGAYIAAEMSRLHEDWGTTIQSANSALGYRLRTLRARSRILEQDNCYAQGFAKALKRHVLGADGIKLQMNVRNEDNSLNHATNKAVEEAWARWGEVCDVGRMQCWGELTDMILGRIAFDGEILIEFQDDVDAGWGISLGLLESDHLDELHNSNEPGNRTIRMGVEYDARTKPYAYHLWWNHPGENQPEGNRGRVERRVVPADRIVHPFLRLRPSQRRGVPWMFAAMADLKMLGGYREAELVAARVAASKAGFFKHETPEGWDGETNADGSLTMEVEPGMIEDLPMGTSFEAWDPTHPNGNFDGFTKAVLRGISGALGMSYTTLSQDLEGVNFSSIRAGLLDERDEWMKVQGWFGRAVCRPIFRKWLPIAHALGMVDIAPGMVAKCLESDCWVGRRWQWVDPEKDIRAAQIAVNAGFRSRTAIVREIYGRELEDVFDELAEETKLAAEKGINLAADPESAPARASADGGGGDSAESADEKPEPPKRPARKQVARLRKSRLTPINRINGE